MYRTNDRDKGFTLIEMLLYVTILSMLLLVVSSILITMTRSYTDLKVAKQLNHAAIASLEQITREIRASQDIVPARSVLDASPGRLFLQVTSATTTEFYVTNGTLNMNRNEAYEGPLTSSDVKVESLVFSHFVTPQSEAVRVALTLESVWKNKNKKETFYSTVILRGTY